MAVAFDTSSYLTLKDVAAIEAGAPFDVIDETVAQSPEVDLMPADTVTGAAVELSVLTKLPTAGFRNANEGSSGTKPEWDTKLFETQIIDQRVAIDIAGVLRGAKDQGRVLVQQTKPYMKSIFSTISKTFWYGTKIDAKASPGVYAQYSADSDHEVDAKGTTDLTSVWFTCMGADLLQFLYGNGQTIAMKDQWREETCYDKDGKPFNGLVNFIDGRVGAKLHNKHAVCRVKNISLTIGNDGKTFTSPLSPTLLHAAKTRLEELGYQPNAIWMRPLAQESYRQGLITALVPDPQLPDSFMNIPIIPTINLSKSEEVLLA